MKKLLILLLIISMFVCLACDKDDSENSSQKTDSSTYIVGRWGDSIFSSQTTPCYWKDGVRHDLESDSGFGGTANAVWVDGSDVYIAGSYNVQACYWKNGRRYDVGPDSSSANAIQVVNGKVYVMGEYKSYN